MELNPERYLREFQSLKELTESLRHDPEYACSEGLKDVNRRKNRYKDILPYDNSRVTISEYPGVPGSDYINANYVKGSTGSTCAYIASQGPLPNTLVDFWRMIWECETTVIVMACNESESGKYKCESYWPSSPDEEQQYGNITVKLVKWKNVCPDFLVRTLEIRQEETTRTVIQFHYGTWPDHGVPVAVTPILELVRLMRDVQATETRPILVHCSAGCGRTGTICSIDFVWALLRAGKLNNDFSLYSIIYEMRKQRIAMVQTLEQYILCYKAVAALFQQQLKIIDAHTYENLDEDGEPLILRSISLDSQSSESDVPDDPRTEVKVIVDSWHDSPIEPLSTQQLQEPTVALHEHSPQSSFVRRAPSLDSVISSNHNTSAQFQDKLVGRATVIRRPSIASLKKMFENLNTSNDAQSAERERRLKLQRSQSTRERGPTRISVATRSTINSNGILSVMDIGHEAAAVARQAGFRRTASSNDMTNENRVESQLSSIATDSTDETSGIHSGVTDNRRLESHPKSILKNDANVKSPPPKPPRTYIYGSIVHDRERGRMIARISSTRDDANGLEEEEERRQTHHQQQYGPPSHQQQVDEINRIERVEHEQEQYRISLEAGRRIVPFPSLPSTASSHVSSHASLSHHPIRQPLAGHPLYSHHDLSEGSQIQMIHPHILHHPGAHNNHTEPIYQTLHVHAIPRHPTPLQHQLQQSQHSIYGTIGPIRREIHLSHPSLLPSNMTLVQHSRQATALIGHATRVASVQRLPPTNAFTNRPVTAFEDSIYDVPKKRPILSEKGTRPPVTYVRPQPNPRLQAAKESSQNPSPSISSREGNEKNSSTDKGDNDKNNKKLSKHSLIKKSSFSLSSLFSRSKNSNNNKTQSNHNDSTKKTSSNDTKKIKSQSQLHSHSVQNLTSQAFSLVTSSVTGASRSGSVVFRPARSHRFSPPTQWTQV